MATQLGKDELSLLAEQIIEFILNDPKLLAKFRTAILDTDSLLDKVPTVFELNGRNPIQWYSDHGLNTRMVNALRWITPSDLYKKTDEEILAIRNMGQDGLKKWKELKAKLVK